MSWFSKCASVVVVLFAVSPAHAKRYQFSKTSESSQLRHTSLRGNGPTSAVEVELSLPHLDMDRTEDGFEAVVAPGLEPLAREGAPDLYTTGSLIAVPEGYTPVLSVVSEQSERIPAGPVRPFQKRFRCGGKAKTFSFKSALYQSQSTYPANKVTLQEVGRLQSQRLVRVGFYPLQMDFARNELVANHHLRVRVDFKPNGRNTRPALLPPALARFAKELVANDEAITVVPTVASQPEIYLIVTADALASSLKPLIDWKQSKGMKVELVTYSQAGSSKETALTWIQTYYNNAAIKPSYLLMVGNKTSLPPFMESTDSGNAASDMRFAQLAGSDNVPDVMYGRLLADNTAEVDIQVAKWIQYEKTPEKNATWYPQATTIASSEGSGPSDEEYAGMVAAELSKNKYSKIDSFLEAKDTATFSNISSALAAGRSWIAYFGHGTGTAWGSTTDKFDVKAVEKIDNRGKLPILIDVACQNASWVNISKPFGKAWVNHQIAGQGAGAVAFYGGSVNISWDEPAVMSVGIAKYHFEKPVTTLGGSVLAGQMYLVEKMGKGENTLDNLKWYNLFGDPSLVVRTNTPKSYQFTHALVKRGNGMSMTAAAKDAAGNGVAGLLVSIGVPGSAPQAVATTDNGGRVFLNVPTATPGSVITVTGYNAETYQAPL